MTSHHDRRRGGGGNYVRRKSNRSWIQSHSLMAKVSTVCSKLQLVSIVFAVLIINTDVVSYNLIATSMHKKVQLAKLENNAALNTNIILRSKAFELQNVKLKPTTPLEMPLRANISSFFGHDILSANDIEELSTTTTINIAKHGDLQYITNKNKNVPPAENYKFKPMNIKQDSYRVI